jgi:hypothetical protein
MKYIQIQYDLKNQHNLMEKNNFDYSKSQIIKLIFKINCSNIIAINILMMYYSNDPKI